MSSTYATLTLAILLLIATPLAALADEYICGYDPEIDGEFEYPFSRTGPDSLRAVIVFVSFPDTLGVDEPENSYYEETHGSILEELNQLVYEQSQGMLRLTRDSFVLFPQGKGWDYEDTTQSWMAELPARYYTNESPNMLPSGYFTWAAQAGFDSWWSNTTFTATHLFAEILYKIWTNYGGTSPFTEPVDYVFFVFNTYDSPYRLPPNDIGGRPSIEAEVDSVATDTDGFFSELAVVGNRFVGTGQAEWRRNGMVHGLVHELGHKLGFEEGPPALHLGLGNAWDTRRYYYGNYNSMCQHWIDTEKAAIWGLHWLATTDWIETVDFTGQNLHDVVLYDIRTFKDPVESAGPDSTKGRIYKFKTSDSPQYFVMAFHAGIGVDDRPDSLGNPVLPAKGLEIYHCAGIPTNPHTVDLESAFGLYSSIMDDELPSNLTYPPTVAWGAPDSVSGCDNHDIWPVAGGGYRAGSNNDEYNYYVGDKFDFFRIDLPDLPGDEPNPWNKDEFSFRTNPSCFWYYPEATNEYWYRTNPQSVGNGLYVKIKEQYNDYDPYRDIPEPHMVVDLFSVPDETIESPDSTLVADVGDTVNVRWTNYFSGHIDSVGVFFYPVEDNNNLYFSLGQIHIDAGDSIFEWIVQQDQGTDEGRLRVRFHNPYTDCYADEFTGGTFVVDTTLVKRERIIAPDGGETLVAYEPYEVRWTSAWGTDITRVDMLTSTDSGETWTTWADSLSYDTGDTNVYEWTPTNEVAADGMRIKLRFHSQGIVGEDSSDGDFVVVPVNARYIDVSDDAIDAPWTGQPACVTSIDSDGDGITDVVVSISSGGSEGKLYRNESDLSGDISLTDVTYTALPNQMLAVGYGALAAADFNKDGDEDFFACRPDSTPSRLFVNTDGEFSISTTVFADLPDPTILRYAQCATWVDFDHDGDLDLHVGRANGTQPLPDALFRFDHTDTTFDEVAVTVGLEDDEVWCITSAIAWADINNDGLWEVARASGGGTGAPTQLFRQTGPDSTFEVVSGGLPANLPTSYVRQLRWVDLNRDNALDLVVICGTALGTGSSVYVCYNEDGTLTNAQSLPTGNAEIVQGCAFDYDLDSWFDLVLAGANSGQPLLLANLQGLGEEYPDFQNIATAVGLSTVANIRGVLACDFNQDGDLDVIIGRERKVQDPLDSMLLASVQRDYTDTPAAHWVGLRLVPVTGYGPFGASVALSMIDGTPLGVQVVDGGGVNGSQQPRELIFGLGEYDEDVNVAIRWPHWASDQAMEFALSSTELDELTVIEEFTQFEIDNPTVSFTSVWDPYTETFDWVFTWETDHWTEKSKDKVLLNLHSGNDCESMPVTLQDTGTAYVKTTITYEAGVYEHEVRWVGRSCYAGCTYKYTVESGLGQTTDSYTPRLNSILFANCPGQG